MKRLENDVVSASEIASWAWCPEAWRLEKGLQLAPGNKERLAAGEVHHERKARVERQTQTSSAVGRLLLVVGVLLVVLALGLLLLRAVR